MVLRGSNDRDFAAALRKICGEDPIFFINAFASTYDPRKTPSAIPFVLYPFQVETVSRIVDSVMSGSDLAITKSRDMGATWMVVTVPFWMWAFRE